MDKTSNERLIVTALMLALLLTAVASAASATELPPLAGFNPLSIAPPANSTAAQSVTVEGTWSTRVRERDDDRRRIQLNMEIDRTGDGTWNTGFGIDDDELQGLTLEQAAGDVASARFELVRDAGTVAYEGIIRNGRGAGTFAFTPNPAWQREMAQMGFDDLSAKQVFQGAIHDISREYVGALRDLGYTDLAEDELFSFAIHGVSVDFINAMNGLGYDDIPARKLITMRIHGVRPEWVRQMRRAFGG